MKAAFPVRRNAGYMVGLLVFTLAGPLRAAEDVVVNRFDAEDEALAWTRWWGSATQTYEFDASVDASASASSGSLKATIGFDFGTYAGDNQFAVRADFPGGATVDGTKYTNLTFKVRWAASSPVNADGNFGYLEYGFRNSDWSQTWLGGQTLAKTSGDVWTTIKAPIDPTLTKLEGIAGVVLKLWSGGAGGLTGTSEFWVDDVVLVASTNVVVAPPSLRLQGAQPGLRIAASASGQQYQRQNVRTLAADADGNARAYGWVGQPGTVTYSLTVADFPDGAHSGFQAQIFLVPEAGMPYGPGDTSIDWNAPQLIFVQIANNADGTAAARFMYKTNLPSANSMLWNTDPATGPVGTLAILSDARAAGTWSVSFRNNTAVTLTAPSGSSTNFILPSAAAELFTEPLYAYFGAQPNNVGNIGQALTLSRIAITGAATALDDSFAGASLDPATWAVVAQDPGGVVQVPPTAKYWLAWDAPATGFMVQAAPLLEAGAWGDTELTNIVQMGSEKRVLVPAAQLPSAAAGYFRLHKP